MAKRTIKINIKLPAGVVATKELTDKATKAANDAITTAVDELAEAQALAKELADKGIRISAQELMTRKTTKKRAGSTKGASADEPRKRVVLTDAKRNALIADLKAGIKIAAAAEKYGVSTATVMNTKTAAGLTKKREK